MTEAISYQRLLEILSDNTVKLIAAVSNNTVELITAMHWDDMSVWVTVAVTIGVVALTILHFTLKRMRRSEIRVPELEQNQQYRFRKRDKVRFFARKVFRKGQNAANKLQRQASAIKEGVAVPEYSRSGRRLRKRERMLILAKRMFQVKQEPPKLLAKELPSSVLEADLDEDQKPNLPEEVMYLLQSVKVFGHCEKGIFLQLCRHMEILKLQKDEYLFSIGDPDEFMYVVQDGQIDLYITVEGSEAKLSEFTAGESLHSLFSILDVLTGHPAPYKTVYARATKDSNVIRLPVEAFSVAFQSRQDALVQMVQVVMTRMQRVTFLALHNYLGLSHELLKMDRKPDGKHYMNKIAQSKESLGSKRGLLRQNSEGVQWPKEERKSPKPTDETDATPITDEEPPKEMLPKEKSNPEDQTRKLRFEDVETVKDDDDNVFHRKVSLSQVGQEQDVPRQSTKDATSSIKTDAVEDVENTPLQQKLRAFSVCSERSRISSQDSAPDSNNAENTPLQQKLRAFSVSSERSRVSSQDSAADSNNVVVLNEPEILDLVVQDMLRLFGFDNEDILSSKLTLLQVPEGYELIQEGDQDVSVYFVVYGALRIYQASMHHHDMCDDWQNVKLFHAYPGMLTGQLAVLTGEPSFFSVRAGKDSVIAKLTRKDFYSIMRHYPRMVLNTAHTVVQRASPFTRQIDFALDWTMVEAGKALYKQGALSDCMYIVLHGRLRSVHEKSDGKKELVAEYGRGEIVGMMEALRGSKRAASMHAVRDTELAKIPEGLLKHIRRQHPSVVSHLVSLMSDKMIGTIMSSRTSHTSHPAELLTHKHQMAEETKFAYGDVSNHLANLSTVAVLPVDRDFPVQKFTFELEHALHDICDSVLLLSSEIIKKRLGQSALDSAHEYRLMGWLAQQEDLHRIVMYQTDDHMSAWTKRCIRQSDAILIVANGDSEPGVGELERELENYSVRSLKVLVLLHRPEVSQPTRTVEWLNMRGWLTEHLHIKGSKRLFTRTLKSKLRDYRERLFQRPVDKYSDFSRLARFLTGTSVALVLGGGGARGISQIGVIKALLEAGIPIDLVGGTSIGSFVSALWAGSRDLAIVRSQTALFSSEMSSVGPKLFDLTYPITSMFSGSSFNRGIHMIFKDTQIEDLWLPYYSITTDITSSRMRVHTDGSLWRYVRSSMSLSGYLPPICDPKDGHLLMDGGYVNNLPADVARSRGACRVIAVDVGAATETNFTNYGDHLSGWWLLWKKWTGRWTGHVKIPDLNEIQSRLSYISCHYLLDLVKTCDYVTYLRPPIMQYRTMEFSKWQEILEVGHVYGKEVCTEEWAKGFWKELQNLNSTQRRSGDLSRDITTVKSKLSMSNLKANASFTDLSEVLRRDNCDDPFLLFTDFSDLDGYESSPDAINTRTARSDIEPMFEPSVSDVDRAGSAYRSQREGFYDESSDADDEEVEIMRRFSSHNVLSTTYK